MSVIEGCIRPWSTLIGTFRILGTSLPKAPALNGVDANESLSATWQLNPVVWVLFSKKDRDRSWLLVCGQISGLQLAISVG